MGLEIAANVKSIEGLKATDNDERYSVVGIDNLWLHVSAKGRKVWVWRGRIAGGAAKKYTLGPFPAYGLGQAREWAGEINLAKGQGRDLLAEKKAEKVAAEKVETETVDWLFGIYMEAEGESNRTAGEKRRCYEKDISPIIGMKSIHDISHDDLDDVIARKAETALTQAGHVCNILKRLFRWSVTTGRRQSGMKLNPAADLVRPRPIQKRDRYLTDYEIGLFLRAVEEPASSYAAYAAAWWLILHTGVRRDEAFGATFDEFDFRKGEWLIPGNRTKNGVDLLLPLPAVVVDRLRGINRKDGQNLLWFATNKDGDDKKLSGWTKAQNGLIKRMGELAAADGKTIERFTTHDLRRTLSTGMNGLLDENDDPLIAETTVERVINHVVGGVAGVYNRHKYYKEKKAALQHWADHLEAIRKSAEARVALAA
ncbi:integrase arm-type DNA-binding domain-containing protein [Sphingobium sp. WW5]|uniref:tyrosine-type recombinase/integrase n=1 Tax=unclassified Sphingobium TaxID=2611147 RepID=UPI003C211B9D